MLATVRAIVAEEHAASDAPPTAAACEDLAARIRRRLPPRWRVTCELDPGHERLAVVTVTPPTAVVLDLRHAIFAD